MKKIHVLVVVGISGIIIFIFSLILLFSNKDNIDTLDVIVLDNSKGTLLVQDKNNVIYTLDNKKLKDVSIGEVLTIKYAGLVDKMKIKSFKTKELEKDEYGIPIHWLDDGLFKQYYKLAFDKVKDMSIDEKIGQVLLTQYSNSYLDIISNYYISGFIFGENDFKDKDKSEVIKMIDEGQMVSKIPLLTAVFCEGGDFTPISSNPKLFNEPFKSARELYNEGGFDKIKEDTINKTLLLDDLGINVNFGLVVDVTTNKHSYMNRRAIGLNTDGTSEYAKIVIDNSKNSNVSYVLKHYPGYGNSYYGNNAIIYDNFKKITNNYLPPFKEGINYGAQAILINNNIYISIDYNPASISTKIHNILRNDLNFKGIIIAQNTDKSYNRIIKLLLSGNDLIITNDYVRDFNLIKENIKEGKISEDLISKLAFRVIAWKYYKGLMFINEK